MVSYITPEHGETVDAAAKREFGDAAFVDYPRNAKQFDPDPQMVAKFGQPVATVRLRDGISYYVFVR